MKLGRYFEETLKGKSIIAIIIAIIFGFVLFEWICFNSISVYRAAAFHTTPVDDYTDHLRWIASFGNDGSVHGSPTRERFLSVAIATPLFLIVPPPPLSLLPAGTDVHYLRALFALSLVNNICLVSAALMSLRINLTYGVRIGPAIVMMLLIILLGNQLNLEAVDGIGILATALAIWSASKTTTWAKLLLIAALLTNEKISIFMIPYLSTFVLSKDKNKLPALMISIIVFVGYVIWRKLYGVGNEHQVSEGAMLLNAGETIAMNISLKGLVLSWLPTMVVFLPLIVAWRVGVQRTLCLGVAAGAALLLCLAILADVKLSLGRIVFYALPGVAIVFAQVFKAEKIERTEPS